MKKLAALVSAFLILAACSAVPAEQLMPAQSAASDVHNAPGPEALDYQVETRLWEDSVRAEDGTMLAWYQFHLPEMSVLHRRPWRQRRPSIPGFPAGSRRKSLRV